MTGCHVINLTAAWIPPEQPGAPWRREFGLPTGLSAGDRLWLAVDGPADSRLVLNGTPLAGGDVRPGPTAVARHEVTQLLQTRNELLLSSRRSAAQEPDAEAAAAGPPRRCGLPAWLGRVWLEIEPTA